MRLETGRIVVGYDERPASVAALDWAATEAGRRELPLTVLHVVDYLSLSRTRLLRPWPELLEHEGRELAERGARRARSILGAGAAPAVDVTAVTYAARITGTLIAASRSAALLVLGTRTGSEFTGLPLGSAAFAVTAHAHCPCVVVRGKPVDAVGSPPPDRPIVVGVDGSPASQAAVLYATRTAGHSQAGLHLVTAYRAGAGRPEAERTVRHAARTALELDPGMRITELALAGRTIPVLTDAAAGARLLVLGSRGHGGFVGLMLGSVCQAAITVSPCPVVVVHATRSSPAFAPVL